MQNYILKCIPSQYTAKKVHLALCSLINCRTGLTDRDYILVLISTMLRPPSANVFNSDSLFKATGLLFQRNGYAIVFNFSTFFKLFGSEVRVPVYQMEPHSTDCRAILYKWTHLFEELIQRYIRSYLYLLLTPTPTSKPQPKGFPFLRLANC